MTISQKIAGNERIRSPNLAVLATFKKGVPMEEALRRADEAGLVIASNKRIDQALIGRNDWESVSDAFPLWTGTLVAFEEPGERFGKTFEFTEHSTKCRYVLDVPEEYRGMKNAVLVSEHPDFTIEKDKKTRIIHASKVGIVTGWTTASDGWFYRDSHYHLPSGKEVDGHDEHAIFLIRGYRGIRLVVRGYSGYPGFISPGNVRLDSLPSNLFGVAVEGTPEQIAEAAKMLKQTKVGK